MLALALTVILIAAVTSAMRFQLFTLDSSRGELEEAHLARAILARMSADIRGTVREVPLDFSEVSSLAEGTLAGDALDGVDPSQLEELAGSEEASAAIGDFGADEEMLEESNLDSIGETTSPSELPGLYGVQNVLQIDTSRLPRIDEYQRYMVVDANGLTRIEFPSDVKTVTYYVRPHQSLGGAATPEEGAEFVNRQLSLDPTQETFAGGLVRRAVDRLVALWNTENNPGDTEAQYEELLATEVVALQFQYFDGLEWLPEWDATVQEGLPKAIEIAIVLDSSGAGEYVTVDLFSPEITNFVYGTADPTRKLPVYRKVVPLPLAAFPEEEEPLEEGMESDMDDESESDSSSSESGGMDSAGGGL